MTLAAIVILASLGGMFLVAMIYTSASYLIRRYDQRLARFGKISPGYGDLHSMPTGWKKWRGFLYEVFSTAAFILFYPLGWIGRRTLSSKKQSWGRPIILIHGYNHNRSGWLSLRRRLMKSGLGPIFTFNLPARSLPIEGLAKKLAKEIEKTVQKNTNSQLILIGHSMGGLVAAYYAEHLAHPHSAHPHSVSHVLTLGTPLRGTRTAVLAETPAVQQMRTDSEFVRQLIQAIKASSARYYHIASRLDNIILPFHSSLLGVEPQQERLFNDLGHMTLLFSRRVSDCIITWLKATTPEFQTVEQAEGAVAEASPVETISPSVDIH